MNSEISIKARNWDVQVACTAALGLLGVIAACVAQSTVLCALGGLVAIAAVVYLAFMALARLVQDIAIAMA